MTYALAIGRLRMGVAFRATGGGTRHAGGTRAPTFEDNGGAGPPSERGFSLDWLGAIGPIYSMAPASTSHRVRYALDLEGLDRLGGAHPAPDAESFDTRDERSRYLHQLRGSLRAKSNAFAPSARPDGVKA